MKDISKTIKDIEKYAAGMKKGDGSQPHKPFFTLYAKQRHWLNPLRYILGEYKFNWFEENKQPIEYKNVFELMADSVVLDTKDVTFIE